MLSCSLAPIATILIYVSTHALVNCYVPHFWRHRKNLEHQTAASVLSQTSTEDSTHYEIAADNTRRRLVGMSIVASGMCTGTSVCARNVEAINRSTFDLIKPSISGVDDIQLRNYFNPNLPNWRGTSLELMSLSDAANRISSQVNKELNASPTVMPMGRWPDPILRRPSSSVSAEVFQSATQFEQLKLVANSLKNTAKKEGAVGLAAQQCGVDASLIFIDGVRDKKQNTSLSKAVRGEGSIGITSSFSQDSGIFLVNPRIIDRSSESEMLVWTEECLVLPPEFRATLLRDAAVIIEYETLGTDMGNSGYTKQIALRGELARCAQHEMDHDRGVLIVDHVDLSELLTVGDDMLMADVENADGLHSARMKRAYLRNVRESALLLSSKNVPLAYESREGFQSKVTEVNAYNGLRTYNGQRMPWFVKVANAIDETLSPTTVLEGDTPLRVPQPTAADNANTVECNQTCLEERKRIIEQRRAMMNQSRTNTIRGDVLKLSEQRAALYGTKYGGLPSATCSTTGFCP
jgi:peptide deformylase